MMKHEIPAPGFRLVSGKRAPADGKWWVQLRSGWVDKLAPWPAKGPRWKWGDKPDSADIVAVKRAE